MTSNAVFILNKKPELNVTPLIMDPIWEDDPPVVFTAEAWDFDEDELTYEWYIDGVRDKVDDDTESSTYTFTPSYESQRMYKIRIEVTDETAVVFYEWDLVVYDRDRGPEIETVLPEEYELELDKEGAITFTVGAIDPDGEAPLFQWYLDGDLIKEDVNEYIIEGENIPKGDHTVEVIISDGNLTTSRSWNITVTEEDVGETLMGKSYDWWGLVLAIGGAIITAILAVFGFLRVKKKRGKLKYYMKKIDEIKKEAISPSEKEKKFFDLRDLIKSEFSEGKIEESHYLVLEREIETTTTRIRKESIKGDLEDHKGIKREVEEALEDGVITDEEYAILEKRIIQDKDLTASERKNLLSKLSQWAREDNEPIEPEVVEEPEEPEIVVMGTEIDESPVDFEDPGEDLPISDDLPPALADEQKSLSGDQSGGKTALDDWEI
jgi:hypothetical protein